VPFWSCNLFPHLTANNASAIVESVSLTTGIGVAVPGLVIAYFLGHVLLWIARSGKPDERAAKNTLHRVCASLFFRIPKPPKSYDESLQSLYSAVQAKFAVGGTELLWEQFFPVVKSYLSRNLTCSLVATYQNKYTLHRSITAAAAGLFWLSIVSTAGSAISYYWKGIAPHWGLLVTLSFLALLLVWGFSSSYMYHWKMFGNTIITESYSIIYGPSNAQTKQ
jgi:hypothetical protein